MDRFFKDPAAVERHRQGPLGPYMDSFGEFLAQRGYARFTAAEKVRAAARLGRWLERRTLGPGELSEALLGEYLFELERLGPGRLFASDRAALPILLEHLREQGVAPSPAPEVDESPCSEILDRYGQYLREERGLCPSTCRRQIQIARRLLSERFGAGPVRLDRLEAGDILRHFQGHALSGGRGRAQWMTTALRSFLRFLRLSGEISADLAACVPTVPAWRFARLPRSMPAGDVERLLQSCDRGSARGKRDYAILLLLARLGLRAGEVVALSLDDIDWRAGEIRVPGKGQQEDRLPIAQDVGEALVDYIRHGRPQCSTRRVFVLARAPRRGFRGPSAVTTLVRRAIERAGLDPPQKGAHLLRHSLACRMLGEGASMEEIGEVLRHRDAQTTEIYAKVDLHALRALAPPWPRAGGDR